MVAAPKPGSDPGAYGEVMKISDVELRRITLPLVSPFRTSFGSQTSRNVLLVKVTTPEAEGWGECVALSEPVYSPEYVDEAEATIKAHLLPRLFAAPSLNAFGVAPALAAVKGHPMAKAALEMAVLDAELRSRNEAFRDFIGTIVDAVPSGVSVGIMGSVGELLDAVRAYLDAGYVRIKLKIEPGWDIEPVRAVRETFGDDVLLQVDANTAYTLGDARHLARLDAFDLLLIEQPLPEDDIVGHAALAKLIKTPVCLDESIESAKDAADAISIGACAIVNVKPGRVGGYLEARRVHDVCAAHNIPVWCGGMLETGIGRAANTAIAGLPNYTLPGDISASDRFYAQDITPPFVLENGTIRVPTGPGWGVEVIPDILDSVTTSVEHVGPS